MKRLSLIIAGIIVVAVLIGAAFVAGRMLMTPEGAAAEASQGNSGRVMEIVNDDGSGPVNVRITFKPAPELPQRVSEANGLFVKREDDAIFVGTGEIEVDIQVDDSGKRTVSADHSGPEIEAVVTQDTILYKDVTKVEVESSARESGEQVVQQKLQPVDSLEEVGENTELEVWGERRGDRIVAEVVVYRLMDEE
jgi:hypothetical protein